MTKHMKVMALVVLLVAFGVGSAHAYLIEGSMPSWWSRALTGGNGLAAQWGPGPDWYAGTSGVGPAPNELRVGSSLDPLIYRDSGGPWMWSGTATDPANVDAEGIIVPGGTDEYAFDLELGNHARPQTKLWYLEFALDGVPTYTDGTAFDPLGADAGRFAARRGVKYPGQVAWTEVPVTGTWKLITGVPNVADHWVWYAEWRITPQPQQEKFWWDFNSDQSDPYVNTFHVARVTTGTWCTPEPASMALLACACGGIGMMVKKRRKS